MADRLDIIVFGATGFTGKFTLPQVFKLGKTDGRALTWGVAGRSEEKLKNVLAWTAKRIGLDDLNAIPIIIADITDEESIKKMTARAKIIINCCGPYQFYGEVVVKSCIETGTHHVDVSGESHFAELIEAKYHKAAEEKGIYIVSSCGFDSIPSDLGVVYLENNFEGTLNSMEVYVHGYEEGGVSGPTVSYGTWESAVNFLGNIWELFALRKSRNLTPLPALQPKLSMRFPIRKADIDGKGSKWLLSFPSTDRDVIMRSQRYFYEHNNKRPVQTNFYVTLDTCIDALKCIFFGMLFVVLSQFKYGQNLLLRYPEFFSAGLFSHENPAEDKLDLQHFSFTLYGEGWSEKLAEGEDQYKTPPNKAIVGRISGTNPGYGFTCTAIALCAIMILTEPKNLPSKGGVYTTATAFSKTSLVEQLQKNGVVYEILSTKDL